MLDLDAAQQVYEFGQFQLDVRERALSRAGELVPLAPKAFDTLLVLVERQGRVIEKEELLLLIWPDSFVEENNLAQNIFQLRKTLGQTADGRPYIETISRRGYRFVAEVQRANGNAVSLPMPAMSADVMSVLPMEEVPTRRPRRLLGWAAAGVTVLLLIGFPFWSPFTSRAPVSFLPPHLTKLTNTLDARLPALSRDGKYLAFVVNEAGKQSVRVRLAILPIEGGQALRFFDAPVNDLLPVYWTKDGSALTYADTREGVSNLWQQLLDGGAPQQITHFNSGRIFRYAWSRDGKLLVCERGTTLNDLVLISQTR